MRPFLKRMLDGQSPLAGVVVSIAAVALVTAVIGGLERWVPVLSLGVLYLFAVLPVAVVWGLRYAIAVSVGSMLAFNFFFLEPVHSLTLAGLAQLVCPARVRGHLGRRLGARDHDRAAGRERRLCSPRSPPRCSSTGR